jgi:hypothetical protein
MRFRLALGVSAMVGALALPAAAYAVPGDRAISNPAPGIFRLDDDNLEPGCFVPGRNAPVDVDSHLVVGVDALSEEAHVSVSDGAWFSVDQVLVASSSDGYKIANTFDTGTSNNDADVDPGQTATGLDSGTRFVDQRDIIVCVSGGHGDAVQNEPYNQEDGGLVSAINRPIVAPKVTALGVHPVLGINKFKIGFGYSTEQWYTRPAFETTENGNGLFASVTDPEGIPSPPSLTTCRAVWPCSRVRTTSPTTRSVSTMSTRPARPGSTPTCSTVRRCSRGRPATTPPG